MQIFNIIGGLALFIYGIQVMGEGLQKASGDRIRTILKGLTSTPLVGLLTGAVLTAIIQSSSATTVLAVGFVNAGLMSFCDVLSIILGANIGTTITSQLIAFKLTHYALPILAGGFLLYFLCKRNSWKYFGYCLLGVGLLFLGFSIMANALKPLAASPVIRNMFISYSSNVFIALLIGCIATALLQSSSATTGIVISLASLNLINLHGAIPLILGCNIGTCITALLACIGTSTNAKRVAVAHLLFNVISTLLFLPFISVFHSIVVFTSCNVVRQCANAHTIFNITGVLLFIPFIKQYARLVERILPNNDEISYSYLEDHLLHTPSAAIAAAAQEILDMLTLTRNMTKLAFKDLQGTSLNYAEELLRKENVVDERRLRLTDYLIKLMGESLLNLDDSEKIPALIHVVNDVERLGDLAINLLKIAEQKVDKDLKLPDCAKKELMTIYQQIDEMFQFTTNALNFSSLNYARDVLNKEVIINKLRDSFKENHIEKLRTKTHSAFSGVIFLDAIGNFEKMGDHLTNVAEAVIKSLH